MFLKHSEELSAVITKMHVLKMERIPTRNFVLKQPCKFFLLSLRAVIVCHGLMSGSII